MSSIVREALALEFTTKEQAGARSATLLDLIGIARDRHDPAKPLSEYHDEDWADALHEELRENAPSPRRRTATRKRTR